MGYYNVAKIVGTITSDSLTTLWGTKITPQKIVAMDEGGGFFVDQVTEVPIEFHQDAFYSDPINSNKQYYFGNCARGELLTYDSQLSVAEDVVVKLSQCWEIQYLVDSNGDHLVDALGNRFMNLHKK